MLAKMKKNKNDQYDILLVHYSQIKYYLYCGNPYFIVLSVFYFISYLIETQTLLI